MTHWVLTEQVNDYDQHGEYYTASWGHKPSVKELIKIRKIGETQLDESSAKQLLEEGKYDPYHTTGLWSYFILHEIN